MAHINPNVGAVVLTKFYTPEAPPCKVRVLRNVEKARAIAALQCENLTRRKFNIPEVRAPNS